MVTGSMAGMADEGAFVFDNRLAAYGAEPTPERPTDDACERRFLAELSLTTNYQIPAKP